MTREEMEAEFGRPGVENANIVDLITLEGETETVVLVMLERRAWGASEQQLEQIEEKINRYLGYVLDGFLARDYPQYVGRSVLIRLQCAEPPRDEAEAFVNAARDAIRAQGIDFQWLVAAS
jgi:hypothetical protein